MRSQEVLIVDQKFLKAGARYVGELDLRFLRSARSLACLCNVLFARARRLYHLIDRAIAFSKKPRSKVDGSVVDDLGLLVRDQITVATVSGNEAFRQGVDHNSQRV